MTPRRRGDEAINAEGDKKSGGAAMKSGCETCRLRSYAERKPNSLLAGLWRWHTRWCPGWKAHQRRLARQKVIY